MDFDPQTALAPTTAPAVPVQTQPRAIGPNVYQTTFDDETVRKYDFLLYTGRKDQTDRIYLVRPREITKVRAHFHDKLKSVVCNSTFTITGNQEVMTRQAVCCQKLDRSQVRFAVLVLQYATQRDGQLVRPFNFDLKLWKFGADKFLILKGVNKDFPLEKHDLRVLCQDEEWQRMQISALPECLYQRPDFPADVKKQVEEWAAASASKLTNEMGRRLTDEEILKELGQAGAAAPTTTVMDKPVVNFADIIAQPPATVTS